MGWGDEIMVTAQARRLQERDPRKVAVIGADHRQRWSAIWEGNPRIVRPGELRSLAGVQLLRNGPGARPYLDYARFNNRDRSAALVFTQFRAEPGEIYLSAAEAELGRQARGAVILEPSIKLGASPNKAWGWARWQRLAELLRDLRLVQIGPAGTRSLLGVELIETRDFRQACGVLSGAALLIAPEGGLHHAAAALGIPAVVIFGGFISPATTGYEGHVNLFSADQACGMRAPCAHCAEAMGRIVPEEVAAIARGELHKARLEAAAA
jgi:hypothetical protein